MSVKCLTQEQCTKHEALGSPLELKMLASLGEGQTTSMMFLNQYLISPYSISLEWNIIVTRIKEMITNLSSSWLLYKFSLLASHGNV